LKPPARCYGRATSCLAFALVLALASPPRADEPASCEGPGLEALAQHLPKARRFVVAEELLPFLLRLWPVDPALADRLEPDGATIFARDGLPLLVALTRRGCVVGAFETERAALWRRLREALGPAV